MLVSLRRFHRNWILLRIFSLRMIAAVPVSKISTVDSRTLPSYISYNLIMWPRKMPNRSPTAGWKHFSWNSYHKTCHEIGMSPRWTALHTFAHSFLTLVCHKCILTYIASQKLDLYLIPNVQDPLLSLPSEIHETDDDIIKACLFWRPVILLLILIGYVAWRHVDAYAYIITKLLESFHIH